MCLVLPMDSVYISLNFKEKSFSSVSPVKDSLACFSINSVYRESVYNLCQQSLTVWDRPNNCKYTYQAGRSRCFWKDESTSRRELTPGETWQWGQPLKGRGSNNRPSPQKENGFRHLTPVLSANHTQFQHPRGLSKKKPGMFPYWFACGGFLNLWPLSLPLSWTYIHEHIHSSLPLRLGICIVETAAKGTACLREKVRERALERVGNQFLEKYCLSVPCQELVCVVAFLWASVALALWLQPATPLCG